MKSLGCGRDQPIKVEEED
jgi:hypothetical protein